MKSGMAERTYIAIDLKSFYASVECTERGLDPLKTNLVVADAGRTEKTICLAVSPSLKAYGIPGRARLFEVIQRLQQVNADRRSRAPFHKLKGSSVFDEELKEDPALAVDYLIAPPQMSHYMACSAAIYQIYLRYVAPEDIHVYSIDEVFMDVTAYLTASGKDARGFAKEIIGVILKETGITATAGIGTNLYLCKVAMDIGAKHVAPDEDGVRIAQLNEISYREQLWAHKPITDFWRVGRGYAKKLMENGLYTMGDIARCSLGKAGEYHNEELLYQLFGVNAELLIDHAWGYEPCTMAQIKAYRPESSSFSAGQVLKCPYSYEKARIVVQEMTDGIALDLVEKRLVTAQLTLTIGYDIENLSKQEIRKSYHGPIVTDSYGRQVPKPAHGTANLKEPSSSARILIRAVMKLFEQIVCPELLVRRVTIGVNNVKEEELAAKTPVFEQLSLFTDYEQRDRQQQEEKERLLRERKMQEAMLSIKKKFGKNAVIKGMSLLEGATARERNEQIGGHRAGKQPSGEEKSVRRNEEEDDRKSIQ